MTKKVIVNAFHKSGSMFLYRYFGKMAEYENIEYFSENNDPPNQEEYKTCKKDFIVCPNRYNLENISDDTLYIYHVRNPFDILVSQYYSFGWTHKPPPRNSEQYNIFVKEREIIQSMTIDNYCRYVVENDNFVEKFNYFNKNYKLTKNKILSRYSLMFYDFKEWNNYICKSCDVSKETTDKLYKYFHREFTNKNIINPDEIINNGVQIHKRNGNDGQYKTYLKDETVDYLKSKFKNFQKFMDDHSI